MPSFIISNPLLIINEGNLQVTDSYGNESLTINGLENLLIFCTVYIMKTTDLKAANY